MAGCDAEPQVRIPCLSHGCRRVVWYWFIAGRLVLLLEPAAAQCMTQYRYCIILGVIPGRTGCEAQVGAQPVPRWQGVSVPHGVAPLNRTFGSHTPPHPEKGFGAEWPATWANWAQHAERGGRRTGPGEVCESLPNPLPTALPCTQQTRTGTPLWSIPDRKTEDKYM
jgi:hypothetical protein